MNDPTPAQQIRSLLESAGKLDISTLVRTDELGQQLDFSATEPSFLELKEIGSRLSVLSWKTLPESLQKEIYESLRELSKAANMITEFSAAYQGESDRDAFASAFMHRLEEFKRVALPFGGYLLWERSGVEERAKALVQEIEDTLSTAKTTQEEVEGKRADVEAVLKAARDAAVEAGVSQEAKAFHEAAERYEKRSLYWLAGSVFSLAGTVGFAFALVLLWDTGGQISEASVLQLILAKAVGLTVLAYATITAARLFRSNAHLAAVNRHRVDALRTFNKFYEGTNSVDVKDKVLLAATHAAFGQTATGLIGDKGDGSNTLEVFDGIAGGLIRRP